MLKPDSRWLIAALLFVALLLRQGFVVLLLGLLGLVLLAAALWSRYALRRVSYERTLSSTRAFVGDEVVLTQRIANAKLLGLPSLRIDDTVPDKLTYIDQKIYPHSQHNLQVLRRSTALRPYEAVSYAVRIRCNQRGLYTLGPVHLEATDAFGLQVRELTLPHQTRLVVYPKLVGLPRLELRPRHPVGENRAFRQLLTDPARTVGVRDYRRDDPLKTIHWGATARRGELQTRIFEPTTSLHVAIVLDLDTFEYYWQGIRYDLVEQMISLAATVATEAADERLGFGLYVNGAPADSGQLVRIPPNRSPAQLPLVLEALAKLTAYSVVPLAVLLQRLGPTLDWGATIVLISPIPSESLQTVVLRLARRGRRIIWLYAGDDPAPQLPGVDVVRLRGADLRWANRSGHHGPVPIVERQRAMVE